MVEQWAYVTFENELTYSWNDGFKEDNIIPIWLDKWHIDGWETTRKKFNFKVDFITMECDISAEELFSLIEPTLEEAKQRIENKNKEHCKRMREYANYDENKERFDKYNLKDSKIFLFYDELKINTIKTVKIILKDMS